MNPVIVRSLAAASILVGLTRCGSPGTDVPQDGAADGGFATLEIGTPDASASAPEPASLGIEIAPLGAADEVPSGIQISAASSLAASASAPISSERTRLVVDPPVDGTLTRESSRFITFEPLAPLRPGTAYTARLESVEVGPWVVETNEPWVAEFKTPPFALVEMMTPVRIGRRKVRVALRFSAPPASPDLGRFATWRFGKEQVRARYARGESSNLIIASLKGPGLEPGASDTLALTLAAGLPFDEAIAAPEASFQKEIASGPPVRILTAYPQEDASGFGIRVVCDDESAPGARRYYWDRETEESYQVRDACMPELASAGETITIDPPVDFRLSSVGRGGFKLFGDFERGPYTLRIEPGTMTESGGVVRALFEKTIRVPARSPAVRFASKGRYLPPEAWGALPLRTTNVEKLSIEIRHIPKANTFFWAGRSFQEEADRLVADVVARSEIAIRSEADREVTSWLDLPAIVPDPKKGVYEVRARTGSDEWDAVRVVVTDLALIAKRAERRPEEPWSRRIWVWATDLSDTKARAGVSIHARRASGTSMAECTTDVRGGCVLELGDPELEPDQSAPTLLTAETDDSFTYLPFDRVATRAELGELGQGPAYLSEAPYRATAWADRNLYRPGEELHAVVLVRGADYEALSGALPIALELVDPRGRTVRRAVRKTNRAGLVSLDYALDDFAPTGRWTLTARAGEDAIATYAFSVEEFVPERMRAQARALQEHYVGRAPVEVEVEARYLFGGSAAGSPVRLECRARPHDWAPPKLGDYTFGDRARLKDGSSDRVGERVLGSAEALLGAGGTALLRCPAPEGALDQSVRVLASASVSEGGGGRATLTSASAMLHPAPALLGVRALESEVGRGDTLRVRGVLVGPDGAPARGARKAIVTLSKVVNQYGWYWDESWQSERYRSYERAEIVAEREAEIGPDGSFALKMSVGEGASAFIVRASAPGAASAAVRVRGRGGYRYSDGGEETPDPRAAGEIAIEAPDEIELGRPVEIAYEAPFAGRALVSVETHELVLYEWQTIKPGRNSWSFTLGSFEPNVYVSVVAIKDPKSESKDAFLPGRSIGARSIRVKPASSERVVSMKAPALVRSGASIEIEIDANKEARSWASVALVDEGVLQLTRYKSPDPLGALLERRALGVTTYDTLGWSIMLDTLSAKAGGGGPGDNESFDRPKAIRPVALWSGLVRVPASGKLKVPFSLPERWRGELRAMAVVVGPDTIGRAEARVTVRDPLSVSATLPRFLSAGDEIRIPALVSNASGSPRALTARIAVAEEGVPPGSEAGPALEVVGDPTASLTIPDGASGVAAFKVRALRPSGVARIRIEVEGEGLTSAEEGIVPLIPSGPVESRTEFIELSEARVDLDAYLEGWVPGSERTAFWLSANPYGDVFSHLRFLVRYPYGCVEQTVSATRPLLYVGELLAMVDYDGGAPGAGGSVAEMVGRGVRRVLSMQTPSGGFAYWPGEGRAHAWATAYAAHMLLDARARKFEVPADRLDAALDWLAGQIDDTDSDYAAPYIHYVLARSGRAQKGRALQLVEALPSELSGKRAEDAYLLKAALWSAGDRRFESDLRALDPDAIGQQRRYGGSFYSDRRRHALTLATYLELFGAEASARPMADRVAAMLREAQSASYTTQELAWGVSALGKFLEAGASSIPAATLQLGGRPIAASQTGDGGTSWSVVRASEYEGAVLELKKRPERRVYLVVSSSGVRKNPSVSPGGAGLRVERTYRRARGEVVRGPLRLGEVIYAQLAIENRTGERVSNIALVERLPAGAEIENPNLDRASIPPSLHADLWELDHANWRDDRVEAFGALESGQRAHLIVPLRATAAGSFVAPSAGAEAMYDPSVWALTPPERVLIEAPASP